MSRRRRAVAGGLALALAACAGDRVFECADDGDCAGAGAAARCEPAGFCSAADDGCPSGRRYGERAGGDLGGACVGAAGDGENLVPNPGFEAGLLGWDGYQSDRAISDEARTGDAAARVCAATVEPDFTIFDVPDAVAPPVEGATYVASAWVRAAPGEPAGLVSISLDEHAIGSDEAIDSTRSTELVVDATWREVRVEHAAGPGDSLGPAIRGRGESTCFLVDDVAAGPR